MSRKLIGHLLLVGLCFNTTLLQAAPASDKEPTYDPPGLPKLPFEGDSRADIVPENPEELHPAVDSSQAKPVDAVAVSFMEAVELTALAPDPPYIRSHIQGEFLPEQPKDHQSAQDLPAEEYPPPKSRLPQDESSVQPSSPGDFVAEFDGLASTGWIPPDTVVAVGPTHVVEAVNSGFAVYNKSGGLLQGYTTFASFFASALPAGWSGFLFDPRIIYSAAHSQFVMLVLGQDSTAQTSYFFLAFPQTNDPTGLWWIYRFDHQSVPAADSDSWADYCGLGADTWGVYVTCNSFLWTGGFKYAKLWSLDTDGFTGGTINSWTFWDLRWNSNAFAFSLQPAIPHSVAGDQATFFVNSFSGSGNSALLWKLTGDRISSPTLTRATVTTPTYNAIGENVDQPGTTADLDGGDARVMNAVYSNRRVFTVLTDDVDNNGARSGWLTLKLDVDANSLSWSHLLASGAGVYYFYPAITMEGAVGGADGNLAIFGSWTDAETVQSASTNFASSLFKIYTDQPTNSDGPFINYHNGLASYEARDSIGRNRWGDYSGAGYDWSTGNVWGAAEYAGTSNTWRTRITGREIADEAGCTQDAFEPDDSSGQANAISTNGTPQTHNICPVADEDWVSFTISAESEVIIETSGPSGNTRMWLYDSGLSQVEFDDDDGAGLFSRIDRTCGVDALPAGSYFVQIDEFGDDEEIPTYNLAVTATACPQPPPSVITNPATSIGQTGATLNASVNPNGSSTTVYFDYGPTASYGTSVTFGNIGSGTSNISTPQPIIGLSCNTLYHFRARATNANGTTNGNDQTFTSAACSGGGQDEVVLDLGPGAGTWVRLNNSSWFRLHAQSPGSMATGDLDGNGQDEVVLDLGGAGTWVRLNNSSWFRLHAQSPDIMATGDLDGNGQDEVILAFGAAGTWVRLNNSSWVWLHAQSPGSMATGDLDGNGQDEVILDFGAAGTWVRLNNSSWFRLHAQSSDIMATGDLDGNGQDEVILAFGAAGTWVRLNNSSWVWLHAQSPSGMVTGDVDGNGQDEIVLAFGAGVGTWVRLNNSSWFRLHAQPAGSMATGDMDGNGQDEVVLDLGVAGTWVRLNNSSWFRLHGQSPDSMVTGDIDNFTCVLGTDSDGDRLDNCYETNTGVFVNATNTGTDPNNSDTDGDSLLDGDEVLGTLAGLDLPGMGTNPLRQNILLEYDWFTDSLDCAAHSHRPTAAMIAAVSASFAASPVTNPDSSTGITMIHDYGQGGLFTGGNLINDANGVLVGGVNDAEFQAHKAANFAANRHGYFHYTILPHRYNTTSGSSGQAELPGDDLIVSLQCFLSTSNVANTIMHELGHNLFLRHGGFENCNYKPNYNSVMNYMYQFPGVDNNCTPPADGVLDYSIGDRITLNESNLNENLGICGAPSWDWDGDTIIESSVSVDINSADIFQDFNCTPAPARSRSALGFDRAPMAAHGGTFHELQDFDDWGNLDLSGVLDGDRELIDKEIIDCDSRPPEAGN